MIQTHQFRILIVLSLAGTLIYGCGGGGGGGSSSPPVDPPVSTEPPPSPLQLGGNGQLGNIIGGVVSVQDIQGAELASTTTDGLGDYGPIEIPESHTGPIIVKISPATDGSTTFICDFAGGCPDPVFADSLIPFGDPVPYTVTLSAVVPDAEDIDIVNVNAITSAILARAESLGLSEETIIQADQEMADTLTELLGVEIPSNIPTIPNIDLVDPDNDPEVSPDIAETAMAISLMNAGLIALVSEESGNDAIDDVVESLSSGFATEGSIVVSEEFNNGAVGSGELLYATEQSIRTLEEEEPETLESIQEQVPDTDLAEAADALAEARNEIAPVPPVISGTPETTVAEGFFYVFVPDAYDPDGDELVFSVVNLPSWAIFDSTNGSLEGAPENDDVGLYSGIVISVSDGNTPVELSPFALEVTNVNNPPTISGTPPSEVLEDVTYSFSPTVSDPDVGDSLTFIATNLPGWLALDAISGNLSGTPSNSDVGTASGILLSVVDASGAESKLAPFSVTVIDVGPTISGVPDTSIDEGAPYSFTPVSSGAVSFSIQNKPSWASFSTFNGQLVGVGIVGDYSSIVIAAIDIDGDTASLPAFSISVLSVNTPPSFTGPLPPTMVDEDSLYSFTLVATDPDASDVLSFSGAGLPGWLSVDPSTGIITGTPLNANVGSNGPITLTVSDDNGGQDSLPPFSITVTNTNDAPLFSGPPPATSVFETNLYQFIPSASDEDGDALTFSIASTTTIPAWLLFSTSSGELTGTPSPADVGTIISGIIISVTDLVETVSLPAFDLEVLDATITITGTPDSSVNQDAAYSFAPASTGATSFALINPPTWPSLSFDTTTGILEGMPVNSDVGDSLGIDISATDGTNTVFLGAFNIEVININDPPKILGAPDTGVDEDDPYQFIPTGSDVDIGDTLTYSILNQPPWATFDTATGDLSGTPDNDDVGTTNNVTISVSDVMGLSDALAAFDLTVTNVAPVITGAPATSIDQDVGYDFTPTVTGTATSFAIVNEPSWANFDTNTGQLTGFPANVDVGFYNDVDISVTDGFGPVFLGAFNIEVVNINDPPTITGTPPISALVDTPYNFVLTVTDIDVGDTQLFMDNLPGWATLDTSDSLMPFVKGTPLVADFRSSTDVDITVQDASTASDTYSYTLTVSRDKVFLVWDNPTQFADGSPLDPDTDLVGFKVCWTRLDVPVTEVCSTGTSAIGAGAPFPNTYITPTLDFGTYDFEVTVFDVAAGDESSPDAFKGLFL